MKCGYCNGTGEHVNDANRMTTCEFCGGTGVIKPLTNDEWFCSLSTEEKAKVLYDFYYNGQKDKLIYASINVNSFKEWLRHPHREE